MKRKNILYPYILIALIGLTTAINSVSASNYVNYYGIEMTNKEYNTLLNLGFTEENIYYMNQEKFMANKDLDAKLLAQNSKYYKTVYTGLDGNTYSVEVTEDEYENQPNSNARGTVETQYKKVVSGIAQNGEYFRYVVATMWKNMPDNRSFDIIGIGIDDNVRISGLVDFDFNYCVASGDCYTNGGFYDKKRNSTGGAAAFLFPEEARSMTVNLYFDVVRTTSGYPIDLTAYGDYAHSRIQISQRNIHNYDISYNGIELNNGLAGNFDDLPCAISTWYMATPNG